jgi:ketosteroid isomerase-like protein
MSQENVEVVRAIYECWGRGDFRATADKVAPDFEWKQVHGVVEPGSHVGADANRALRSIFEVYEDFRVEAEEYLDAGDTIIVVTRAHGTGRGSGLHMDQRLAQAWTVLDGTPVRMEQYPSREDALEAVGLSEQDAHADSS